MAPKGLNNRKRAAIILAATHEFAEYGFAATSMDRIAEQAQVSKRTVYNHFPSKEDLFQTITLEMWNRTLRATDLPYESEKPLLPQLQHIAASEIEALSQSDFIALARVTLAEFVRSPRLAQQSFEKLGQGEIGLVKWIRAATQDGKLNVQDYEFAAHQFTALIKSFAFWPQMFAGAPAAEGESKQHIIDSTVAMFLDHYEV